MRKRNNTSALSALNNWKKVILEDLNTNNVLFDVVFFTYPSSILEELKRELNPVHVRTEGYKTQMTNVRALSEFMCENKDKYDKFVILRFDFWYKIRITQWPHWDSLGITCINRDITWGSNHYYSDYVFIVSSDSCDLFKKLVRGCGEFPHEIGAQLFNDKIPFNVMYDRSFHHTRDNPLSSYVVLDPEPILEDGPNA